MDKRAIDDLKEDSMLASNMTAYAQVFKDEFESFKQQNKFDNEALAMMRFYVEERETEDFPIKMRTADLYKQLLDKESDVVWAKTAQAYAEAFKDDLMSYMKENKITDRNIGIAKFYVADAEKLKGTPEYSKRIQIATAYEKQKEEKSTSSQKLFLP